MKYLLPMILFIAIVAGCGGTSSGNITEKRYYPAHEETGTHQVYIGQTCFGSGSSRTCTSNYMSMPYTYYVPDEYTFRLELCHLNKKGEQKCKHGTVYVDQTTWHQAEVGQFYGRRKGDTKANPSVALDPIRN